MIGGNPEIEPRSVEEIALSSNNELLRELSLRITSCKKEAENRAQCGAVKLLLGAPLALTGVISGLAVRMFIAQSYELSLGAEVSNWFSLISGSIGLFSIPSGVLDLNVSAQARGEANALTTVLASHLIAEQTKQI